MKLLINAAADSYSNCLPSTESVVWRISILGSDNNKDQSSPRETAEARNDLDEIQQ